MVATTLTAVLSMYVFQYNWDFKVSMMFGSIMSATDPVAVVALLKDLGKDKLMFQTSFCVLFSKLGYKKENKNILTPSQALVYLTYPFCFMPILWLV